jgi:hypothetical protein
MKHILFVLIGFVVLVSGCKKDSDAWEGVYNGDTSGNTVQRVIVTAVDAKTLKMELQVLNSGVYFTFATINNAKTSSSTAATVNEEGTILGSAGTFTFSGNCSRNSKSLTIGGTATNKKNLSDVRPYYFAGSK